MSILLNRPKIFFSVGVLYLVLGIISLGQAEETYIFKTKWGSEGSEVGQFKFPQGIAVDNSGNVYVTDSGNCRVQKFTSDGKFLTKWGSEGSKDGEFFGPECIAVDFSSNVYVVDYGNDRVQKFTSDGRFLTKWGGQGSDEGRFYYPKAGVAVGPDGSIYVTDGGNYRVQKFTSDGRFLTKWGSKGSVDGQFEDLMMGIVVDPTGNVYVVDAGNDRIQKLTSNGVFITKWGSSGSGDGQFSWPVGLAVDSYGNIFVADKYNHRIQKFTLQGIFVTKWGSEGFGDGEFYEPEGVAVDYSGNVYVADTHNHRVQKFKRQFISPEGSKSSVVGPVVGEKINVAVADLKGQNVSEIEAMTIADFICTELVNSGIFNVLERSNMQKILAEQRFQQTGCTTTDCAVQMGKILNVQQMFIGTLSKLKDIYYINIRLVNVETATISLADTVQCKSEEDLYNAVKELVAKICSKISARESK